MSRLKFYIMERITPHTGTHYRECGQLTEEQAKRKEKIRTMSVVMHSYDTEEAYRYELQRLRSAGKVVTE